MKFKDYFSKQALQYAQFRPTYPASLIQQVLHDCNRYTRAMDLATGNGQIAAALSSYFDQVIATDASLEQIKRATKASNIGYCIALAEKSPVAEQSIDLITVGQALHWLQLPHFFANASQCLTKEGVLAIWCYRRLASLNNELNKLLNQIYEIHLGNYWPDERQLVEDGYSTIDYPYEVTHFNQFEIRQQWDADQLIGYIMSWSATQQYIEQSEAPEQLASAFNTLKAQFNGSVTFVWPITLILGTPNL